MTELDRREALKKIAVLGTAAAAAACDEPAASAAKPAGAAAPPVPAAPPPAVDTVLGVQPLGQPPWPTLDPFLFCVHHDDAYPAGNGAFGPPPDALQGRDMGQDFAGRDGWRMYHGRRVPGFPSHPHRGFETVTVTRRGLVDHADSLGAAARYGQGDVQWLTAGAGIQHAEMFPLLDDQGPNHLELFQLWLNLPKASKMVPPHFQMFWADAVPRRTLTDDGGRRAELTVIAGAWGDLQPPAPPPNSWAARPEADVAIWTLQLAPGAQVTLPAARPGTNRMLYFFGGSDLQVGTRTIGQRSAATLKADQPTHLKNGAQPGEVLVLQGRPIGEPTVQYGPFVMNTRQEIQQAFSDYQRTRFGGWPWPDEAPVHGRQGRFARRPDGSVERAG